MSVPVLIYLPQKIIDAILKADNYNATGEMEDYASELTMPVVTRAVKNIPKDISPPTKQMSYPTSKPLAYHYDFEIEVRNIPIECSYRLKTHHDCSIEDLKDMICAMSYYEPSNMRLVHNGRVLEDGHTCGDYNIRAGSTIAMRSLAKPGKPA